MKKWTVSISVSAVFVFSLLAMTAVITDLHKYQLKNNFVSLLEK